MDARATTGDAREHQHTQAHKAHLDFDGTRLPAWDEPDMEEDS